MLFPVITILTKRQDNNTNFKALSALKIEQLKCNKQSVRNCVDFKPTTCTNKSWYNS